MSEETDKFIPFKQACEQAEMAAKDFAPVLGHYRKALTRSGFNRTEALILVRDFQRIMFGKDLQA